LLLFGKENESEIIRKYDHVKDKEKILFERRVIDPLYD
jgi:hypothetical protein